MGTFINLLELSFSLTIWHQKQSSHGFTMQCNMIKTLHQIKNRKLVLKLSLYFIKVGKKLNKSSNSTKCNSCGFGFICNMGLFFLCILVFGFLVHVDIWQTTYLIGTYLTWTIVDISLTTYLPHLVHVVFEWPHGF